MSASGANVGNNHPRSTLAVLDRAFIQFAGFTFGYSASFFNFYQSDVSLIGGIAVDRAAATNLLAYTASFGSGFSATISLEDRRTSEIGNLDQPFDGAAGANAVTLTQRTSRAWWSDLRSSGHARHRRQPACRPGLGLCPGHGCAASDP